MASRPFLIVGGGIAGLACSLGVARIGRAAIVCEQTPAFAEVGAGLQLGPNAARALKHLGAWDFVASASFAPSAIIIRDGKTGKILQHVRLKAFAARFGEPYRVIHRADLLAGLLLAARSASLIELHTGKRIADTLEDGDRIIARTVGGETHAGAALIGADGLRSAIREKLIGDGPPRPSGQALYRSLIPISAAPPDLDATAVSLWLCPGSHAVHYPVNGGASLNIVAAADGAWNGEGWSQEASPAEVADCFRSCAAPLRSLIAAPKTWMKWTSQYRKPAGRWSYGRATLAGDAAHPSLPYLAQGAAMALEDATVLAAALAAEPDSAKAFQNYEAQRHNRTARVSEASRRLAAAYHAKGPFRIARNAVLGFNSPDSFMTRLGWLYGWSPPQN